MSGNKTQQQLETLNDGALVLVERKDGSTLEVKVRKVSVLRVGNLARAAAAGEMTEVTFYTGLTEAELDKVTDAGLIEIQAEGRRLNFPHLGAYYQRVNALNAAIVGDKEQLEKLQASMMAAQA